MIEQQPWTGGTKEEYETQHFGFGAQRFKIAMRQMIEQKITAGVRDMESELQDSLHLNETDKLTLTKSCDKLIQLYCERAGAPIVSIDAEIERLLNVPSNVLLPEDECQLEQTSDEEFENLKEEVAALRKRIERGAMMEALLTAEETEFATAEKVCESALKDMQNLDLIFKNDSSDSVANVLSDTQLLCTQISFMKEQDYNILQD